VPLPDSVTGHDMLLDITHARELLGNDPPFRWRDLARAGLGAQALSGTAASGVATWKLKLCSR
jgi:hypothetical protein